MSSKVCVMCHRSDDDPINFGTLMGTKGIYAHYYCVLMSTTITQSGKDHEGILGFTYDDIKTEINKSINVVCDFCKDTGATISCLNKKCTSRFHFTCGLEHRCCFQFAGAFATYCAEHSVYPKLKKNLLLNCPTMECIACFDNLATADFADLLSPHCCKVHLMHTECAKKVALNSGYFTKCPVCGNVDDFVHGLRISGVFVPMSDATWEGRGAYSELEYAPDTCNFHCLCPYGKKYKSNAAAWKMKLCPNCGSSSAHSACVMFEDYICNACYSVSGNRKSQQKVEPYVQLDQIPS